MQILNITDRGLVGQYGWEVGGESSPPLVISNVQATNIQYTQATITWDTNNPADSQVDYGLDTSYGNSVADFNSVTIHSMTLTGLQSNKDYHYVVLSGTEAI